MVNIKDEAQGVGAGSTVDYAAPALLEKFAGFRYI
jgi:hypothetical protein